MGDYELLRVHNIFVKTNRGDINDTPYDYTLEIPTEYIRIDDPATQKIKVSMMSFTGWYNWTEVNDTNYSFSFRDLNTNISTTIELDDGNYPLQKLSRIITDKYPGVTCKHIPESNKFKFDFGGVPHSINFIGNSHDVLGFRENDDGVNGTTIYSTLPIKPIKRLNIYVRLLDVVPFDKNLNLDNFDSDHLETSNVLCSFPINCEPFQSISFYDTAAGNTL